MNFTDNNIYKLLPAIYRIRDIEQAVSSNEPPFQRYPLQELIKIIANQAKITEFNTSELYDNWFIETCKEWVVPYIGDLLGVRNLSPIGDTVGISQRAYVANTISYRRRKGTAPVLEQLALDISGWRAHVVEFFEWLQATQYMNHIRINRPVTPDLHKMDELERINSAFDTLAHSVDVRHISSNRGRYNIPNIGIFVWRLQSYPLTRCDAFQDECVPMSSPPSSPLQPIKIFKFNPTGMDTQLFNRPKTEDNITHISTEINVPGPLRRRILFDELETRRQSLRDGADITYNFFDDQLGIEGDTASKRHPVFAIFAENETEPIAPEDILICNLEQCCTQPDNIHFEKLQNGILTSQQIRVLADPIKGKFMFVDPNTITKAQVSYSYGFSGDIGGGPYNRQQSISEEFQSTNVWHVGVRKEGFDNTTIFETISKAVAAWNLTSPGTTGIISIMDSRTYSEDLDITIHEKSKLLLIAADWPLKEDPADANVKTRTRGDIEADGIRPYIPAKIVITGEGKTDDEESCGELTINGLLVGDKVIVKNGQLGAFNFIHSTIIPGKGELEIGSTQTTEISNQWLNISLERSIIGAVNLFKTRAILLKGKDCILDKNINGFSIKANKTPVQLSSVTAFGKIDVKSIEAENSIFNNTITAERRQTGCIRYSFVTGRSRVPRKFRCQPELEITEEISKAAEKKGNDLLTAEENKIRDDVEEWLLPAFTSIKYNDPGYAQLGDRCPVQINAGADDGSEMGGFYYLRQPQREANLRIALDEYLSVGLEAGIIRVT